MISSSIIPMEGSIGYTIDVQITGSGTVLAENLTTGEKWLYYKNDIGAVVSRPYP
jgi:hypothetical protein